MRKKSEKGQAMVEFALVLPVLLLIIAGIIDFGWVFHQQVIANNASREAARYASVYYSQSTNWDSEAENKALSVIPSYIKNTYTVTSSVIPKNSNTDVEATVSWQTTTFMPFYSKLFNFKIESVTNMKIENNT